MASHTPIYEQFSRRDHSIRSIQPVQQSPTQNNKHGISIVSSTPVDRDTYSHAHPQYPSQQQHSPVYRERERPQSQYYIQQAQERTPTRTTDLKHSRSQSHALFPIKRKEVEHASPRTPQRAHSVLQPNHHIRVSQGSDTSEQSGLSSNVDQRSQCTAESSYTNLPQTQTNSQMNTPTQKPSGYSHNAAVKGAVGYVPEQPAEELPVFSKKIVVVGDGGSGKTSLLMRYKDRIFPDTYVPTVFENYITRKHHSGTGKTVEIALWDTAGQEEYDRLRPLSYPETSVILVCFAIDCPQSLDSVKEKWYPEVAHFCPETPIILVGCKSDLRTNASCIDLLEGQGLRPTTADEGRAMARFISAQAYIECSSKNMVNVDETFEAAIDVSVAQDTGVDWSRGKVGQQLQNGSMGTASQALFKPGSSGRNGGGGGFGAGASGGDRTKSGLKKRKKSRACKIL